MGAFWYIGYNYVFYSNYSPLLSDRIDGGFQTGWRIIDEFFDRKSDENQHFSFSNLFK